MIDDDNEPEERIVHRDAYARTGEPVRAGGAIADALRAFGITVPAELDAPQLGAFVIPPPPAVDPRARERRLLELGWPRLALSHAMAPRFETPALAAARAWPVDRSILMLAGTKGVGKTVAAAWCALHNPGNAAFRFHRSASFARLGRYSDEWKALLAARAPLCLDDLGAEYNDAKGSFAVDLDELIDTFYGDQRQMIITSNLGAVELTERYGPRMVDRLTEVAHWVTLEGESLR